MQRKLLEKRVSWRQILDAYFRNYGYFQILVELYLSRKDQSSKKIAQRLKIAQESLLYNMKIIGNRIGLSPEEIQVSLHYITDIQRITEYKLKKKKKIAEKIKSIEKGEITSISRNLAEILKYLNIPVEILHFNDKIIH